MNVWLLWIVSGVLHACVGLRLVPDLAAWPLAQALMAGVLLVSALLMPMGLMARRLVKAPLNNVLTWAGLLLMGLFSSLFVLTLLRDAALLLLWLLGFWLKGLPLALYGSGSAEAVAGLALLVTALGFLNARRTPAVVRIDVPIKGLPLALHGFTLAQISDLHVGPTIGHAYLQRIVRSSLASLSRR